MSTFLEQFAPKLETVVIPLGDDLSMEVELPTSQHKAFARKMMANMTEADGEGGYKQKQVDLAELMRLQSLTFLQTCVVEVKGYENTGLEGEFDPELFTEKFQDAAEQIFLTAQAEANRIEEDAAQEAKKQRPSSRGKRSGAAKKRSPKK